MRWVHGNSRKYKCTTCVAMFQTNSSLNSHIKSIHESVKGFECELCQKKFALKGNLKIHVNGFHNKMRPIQCDECQMPFPKRQLMREHFEAVHLKAFLCNVCNKECKNLRGLKSHKRSHNRRPDQGEKDWKLWTPNVNRERLFVFLSAFAKKQNTALWHWEFWYFIWNSLDDIAWSNCKG